jgi:hypothetical protein
VFGLEIDLAATRADHDRRRQSRLERSAEPRKIKRGLQLEPMEERMLLAIGAGPDLEEVFSNDGAPIVAGDVRHISPRELKFRFDSTQVINPASLGAIQLVRSNGDGVFSPGLTASSVVTGASQTSFDGDVATLSSVDDFYNGRTLTFTSGPLNGQSTTVLDYAGATRTFTVAPALSATPTAGATFEVNDLTIRPAFAGLGDRASEVVLRFADRLPDDFYRIHIVGTGAAALSNNLGQPFNGGADLDIDFQLDQGTQIAAVVPQPVFRSGNALTYNNPDGGNGLDQIEVYFDSNSLAGGSGGGGVENPGYYQLIFTGATANTADDVLLNPASVTYFPARAMALLTFNPGDLSILDTGSTVGTYCPRRCLRSSPARTQVPALPRLWISVRWAPRPRSSPDKPMCNLTG